MVEVSHHNIQAWTALGCVLELYRYAPGRADGTLRHSHEEYQFCLSLNFPGEYFYRRAYHAVPVGALSVIHPGELHSAQDREDRPYPVLYRMLSAPVLLLQQLGAQIAGRDVGAPFFKVPVVLDDELRHLFVAFHRATAPAAPLLVQEAALIELMCLWIERYADRGQSVRFPPDAPQAVQRARAYLEDNISRNITMAELAQIAGLNPYHLHRLFERSFGCPPHRYHLQIRIERARRMLARGEIASEVALATGFADQSHFSRHFKRWWAVTPGRYAPPIKNVQDP